MQNTPAATMSDRGVLPIGYFIRMHFRNTPRTIVDFFHRTPQPDSTHSTLSYNGSPPF